MYRILIERTAEKDLRKLDKQILNRLIPVIKELALIPRPHGCHKITGSKQDYRIRVGEYRIIYEIDDKAEEIKIFRIVHRKDAYR